MITINLLPSNVKSFERKIALPCKAYILLAVVFFLGIHVLLLAVAVVKNLQATALRHSWVKIEPQSKTYTQAKTEMKTLETEISSFKGTVTRKVGMTELLSILSASVPKGLWLDRFSLSAQGLMIQGSAVSMTQNEMTIIGEFLQSLKTSKVFSSLCSKMELNSVQRRTIKTYDVVDFVIVGDLIK